MKLKNLIKNKRKVEDLLQEWLMFMIFFKLKIALLEKKEHFNFEDLNKINLKIYIKTYSREFIDFYSYFAKITINSGKIIWECKMILINKKNWIQLIWSK